MTRLLEHSWRDLMAIWPEVHGWTLIGEAMQGPRPVAAIEPQPKVASVPPQTMPLVLGPCPCTRCGRPLYYDGFTWRIGSENGGDHVVCHADPTWRGRVVA